MNTLVRDFYRPGGKSETSFFRSILLTEELNLAEEALAKSDLPRGWLELCRLDLEDRIDFTRDFWLDRLPYHPIFHPFISDFFSKLDDVGVVLSQSTESAPWVAEMIYSLKDNRCFFKGEPPCIDVDLDDLINSIGPHLPRDYLSFLRIHNGFGKLSEMGLLQADQIFDAKRRLMDQLLRAEQSLLLNNRTIDPGALIPFYESFGLASFQCFFADWYPGNEMGNVYLSGIDYTISDYTDRKAWADQLAFPTFLEWLAFYLEGNSVDK